MLTIGSHLSASNGYFAMAQDAVFIGANTFQFFTRNPRGGRAKDIDPEDVSRYHEFASTHGIVRILAHAPFTLNPCSAKPQTREFAEMILADDLERMEYTPNQYYNFHPGSHTGQGTEVGIKQIVELLNRTLKEEHTTTILLETMAGKGSEVGSRFEELKAIIDGVNYKEKMGVCLDTCHVSDAGYDIVNDLDGVLSEFDEVIGLDRLMAIHLNDSMNDLGSHKDRHACIGEGKLGLSTIMNVVSHPKLCDLPFYLETPNELDGYKREIELINENLEPQETHFFE